MNKKIFFILLACGLQLHPGMGNAQTEVESSRNSISILRSEPGQDETMRIETNKNTDNSGNSTPMIIYPEINVPTENYNPGGVPSRPQPGGRPPRPQPRR